MSEDQVTPTTRRRRDNNYRSKACSKSIGNEPLEHEGSEIGPSALTKSASAMPRQSVDNKAPPIEWESISNDVKAIQMDVDLAFTTQLRIINTMQRWLEEALFEFFQPWLPSLLAKKTISTVEEVKFDEWTMVLGKEIKTLPKMATQRIPGSSLSQELAAA